ncbi:MAG: hypothetical protein R3Y43_08460 [Alphaproteobacteria bacterium]
MISLLKETLKTFLHKQILLFAMAIWTIDFFNMYGLKKLNINHLSITYSLNFIEYLLTILIYQQLLTNELSIKKSLKMFFRFFFLQLGIVFIAFIPYIALLYFNTHILFKICASIFALYFFTRLNILMPMLIKDNKVNVKDVWQITKEKWCFWFLAALIFTFPFLLRLFLNTNPITLTIIASVFYIIIPIFQCVYYKKKKALQ